MKRRNIFSVAVLSIIAGSALSFLAPSASAVEIAPGINCEGSTCTNDNDEPYIVYGVATCGNWIYPENRYGLSQEGFSGLVQPHTSAVVAPSCVGGDVFSFGYTGAGPYVPTPPGTGSAGF
jgi:hypothetical protein